MNIARSSELKKTKTKIIDTQNYTWNKYNLQQRP